MHIPDGFLDPKISLGLMGAAVAVLGFCFSKVKEAVTALAQQEAFATVGNGVKNLRGKGRRMLTKLGEQKIYLMGMVASLVFAPQMFNFPINTGTSGHLIGGVLAAVILGPFAGTLVIAGVLIIQSLFFADGGLLVLGANIINMAFLGSFVCYYIYQGLKKHINEWLSIGLVAWLSVMLAATATALEIGLSGTYNLKTVLQAMLSTHMIIGLAEALITIVLIKMVRDFLPTGEQK